MVYDSVIPIFQGIGDELIEMDWNPGNIQCKTKKSRALTLNHPMKIPFDSQSKKWEGTVLSYK